MYCTAGALMNEGKTIYKDFSYVAQMPYHPLLCAAVFKVFNTTSYLFAARMISCLCDLMTVLLIALLYRRFFSPIAGLILGIAAGILYLFNPSVDYANGFAWNHDVVTFLVLLALYIFVSGDFKSKAGFWQTLLLGVILTAASCMRITTFMVEALFFAILLMKIEGDLKQKLRGALPFLAGAFVILIWPAVLIASSPKAFFLNIYEIPKLNGQYLHNAGLYYDKLSVTIDSLSSIDYLSILLITIYLYAAFFYYRRKLAVTYKADFLLTALLPVVFLIIAFIPPAMWQQYFAPPVPFLLISFIFPLFYFKKLIGIPHFLMVFFLMAACSLMSIINQPQILQRIEILRNPAGWQPAKVHNISQEISQDIKVQGPVLTLAPLYAIEGGLQIYPQLSCGPFAYRVADMLSDTERKITNTIGPAELKELFEETPPSAVILVSEPSDLEEEIRAVVNKNWPMKTYDSNNITVYFWPSE